MLSEEPKASNGAAIAQRRADNIERSFHKIGEFVKNFNSERDSGQVLVRLARLEQLFVEYREVVLELQLLSKSEEDYDNLLDEMEEQYFVYKSILTTYSPTQAGLSTIKGKEASFNHMKYPDLKLPDYGGKLEDWQSFHDSFHTAVHSSSELNEIQKFQYLKGCLRGDALRVIDSIAVSSENYSLAWKILNSRYDNKRMLIKCHLKALFDTPAIRRESPESLLSLVDSFERNVSILKRLGEPADRWSSILVYHLSLRLDNHTLREWEHFSSRDRGNSDNAPNDGMPSYVDMIKFLQDHARVLQSLSPQFNVHHQSRFVETNPKPKKTTLHVAETTSSTHHRCQCCDQAHFLGNCSKFIKLSPQQRLDLVKMHRLCLNCLKTTAHSCQNCPSATCRKCNRKHNTLLHLPPLVPVVDQLITPNNYRKNQSFQIPTSQTEPGPSRLSHSSPLNTLTFRADQIPSAHLANSSSDLEPTSNPPDALTTHVESHNKTVLLWTALVDFKNQNGTRFQARILLDSGSQCNFITEALRYKLNLDRIHTTTDVAGIGSTIAKVNYSATAVISSRFSAFQKRLSFLALPSITRMLPSSSVDVTEWNIPVQIRLADPTFNVPGPIDAIVGNECFADLLRYGKISLGSNLPILQKTVFGWIVSGKCTEVLQRVPHHPFHLSRLDNLDFLVRKMWELESCSSNDNWSPMERECERHFQEHISRNSHGRYVVKLPKKIELISQIRDNRITAQRRFLSIERKFESNEELKRQYHDFIEEYIAMGHMREVSSTEIIQSPQYFLPHHAILRPESSTTKLRVVFDASSKSQSGISLNGVLLSGPTIQDSLISIIMRYRMHAFVVSADIAKMYRQILVHPTDQPLQRIYWRDTRDSPLRIYQLQTLTYGTNSASFLATRVLQQLSHDEGAKFPLAVPVLQKDFYMDDMLTGSHDISKLKEICTQVVGVLETAELPLRKFSSNSQEILNMFPDQLKETKTLLEFDTHSQIKTLGLLWEPHTDVIKYKVPRWAPIQSYTKRSILSQMSSLLDPLGMLGPVIVKAKMFIQMLWKEEFSWDQPLPNVYCEIWKEYQLQMPELNKICIPRFVLPFEKTKIVELHGFCDASEQAYGACLYIRSLDSNGIGTVRLLAAKSRIAPLEVKSIPRLELCAALLLVQLLQTVTSSIGHKEGKIFLWTDSTVALYWIAGTPSTWKTFVANRVAEIQRLAINAIWRHVPSLENPADLISRGVNASSLVNNLLWRNGPDWLASTDQPWPDNITLSSCHTLSEECVEIRKTALHITTTSCDIFERYSSYTKLLRVASLCRRFAKNSTPGCTPRFGPISSTEVHQTLLALVRIVQQEHFAVEIDRLAKAKQIPRSSRLRFLNPELRDGLIRVGGRLKYAAVPENRFPE
ncbi:uncharacterized protein LOC129764228 [Toxorhynchites rutilus septentrionalis]|uniref:uncharacterized protein LOC129764228 n=1 Tax=Toxorhynchites rutilus septentrionalis TaxID=329112 RepID=UPI00247A7E26|nr:uncharacterized protein LOC129764228 [Toxorhynchites rutilus septentrionalis]